MKTSTRDKMGRISLIVFSLILICTGAAHIVRGSAGWSNYWGGLVFAPFAILFGLLLIYAVVFRWRTLKEPFRDKKGRALEVFKANWRKW